MKIPKKEDIYIMSTKYPFYKEIICMTNQELADKSGLFKDGMI